MNSIESIEDLAVCVNELWPLPRPFTKRQLTTMVWPKMDRYSGTDIRNTLELHRLQEPDAAKPKWKEIFWMLRATIKRESGSEFQAFLRGLRVTWTKLKVKHVDAMSDADVWQCWLDAQAFPLTHDTRTKQPMPDNEPCTHCEGLAAKYNDKTLKIGRETVQHHFTPCNRMRRACMAVRLREHAADIWVERFRVLGLEPPPFLLS